jgi:hypothetical protein
LRTRKGRVDVPLASLTMRILPALIAVVCASSIAAAQPAIRMTFGTAERLAPEYEMGVIGDAVIGPDGAVYVLDLTNNRVLAFDTAGRLQWRAGGKGAGPGEFRLAYRLAARPGGGVAVIDWGLGRISLWSAAGKVEQSAHLPFSFQQIDGMRFTADGLLAIAATTGSPRGAAHSIHLFDVIRPGDDSVRHLRSFGRVSVAKDAEVATISGAGGISIDGQGRLLLTRKRPFDVTRYTSAGDSVSAIAIAAPLRYHLDDYLTITRSGKQTFRGTGARMRDVEIPVPVTPIDGGLLLGGRAAVDKTTIDLYSPTGKLEFSAKNPAGCLQLLDIDVARRVIYCRAERNDEPVLIRVPFAIAGRPSGT